ncbi:hypothetical protein [Paenibacillus sp. ISL-20]|uniref:hypothetical protein n=1 Tax=Paenibacillus sp. ISL-20 TaxID=2819163 RepID=UPI001BE6B971|nr:hypothetical protein [Paenibacillus sp. ISL-20]MBT2760003.1 hypothetical protein [Paenibacillus sp. ISL-20]
MFKQMITELDEHYGGLKKYVIKRLIQAYFVLVLCWGFAYALDRWMLKDIILVTGFMPIAAIVVGLPAYWYLDIKPFTDNQQ